jgi:hypothetical protein
MTLGASYSTESRWSGWISKVGPLSLTGRSENIHKGSFGIARIPKRRRSQMAFTASSVCHRIAFA